MSMTRTLGIIGSGMIGGTVARLAADAGLDVILSNSRGPRTLADLAADLGPRVRAASVTEAARAADLIVAAVPLGAVGRLPTDALAGRTVIDTTNYYAERDGRIAALDTGELTSSAYVQRHLPASRVVKALNNVFFRHLLDLARPAHAPDRSALPLAADDQAAKAEVIALLDTLGYDAVDLGTLADSRPAQPGAALQALPYMPPLPEGLGEREIQQWIFQAPAVPAPARRIRELLS
ncbi:NAD(P)-binding domain-containing protein [Streptomyces sp. NPDC006798]|uniref:NADPH-dependent F420 reductase n=1 Tax=Streptomyces sp. NPDC006798 TaxID=3155462 RepID=UPI003408639D